MTTSEEKPKVLGTMAFGDDSVITVHKIEIREHGVTLTHYADNDRGFFSVWVNHAVFKQMFVEEKE